MSRPIARRVRAIAAQDCESRAEWVDLGKTVGIVLVVFGHALRGIEKSGLMPVGVFETIDPRLYFFHMPLFFLLGGVFFVSSLQRGSAGTFLAGRIERLIWPLVLWFYVFIAIKIAVGDMANSSASWDDFLVSPVPGKLHFWFLWALFVIQVSLLTIRPLVRSRECNPVLLFSVLFLFSFLATGTRVPFAAWIGAAVANLPYFLLGILISLTAKDLRVSRHLGAVFLVLFLGLIFLAPSLETRAFARTLLVSVTLLCFVAGLIAFGPTKIGRSGVVRLTGMATMAIYVTHTIFSAGLREIMLASGYQDAAGHLVAGTAVGLIFPVFLYVLAIRLGFAHALGFSQRRNDARTVGLDGFRRPGIAKLKKALRADPQ